MRLLDGRLRVDDLDAVLDDLAEVSERHDVTVQAVDAEYVVSETHLRRAVELADRAIARGENVARERAVEILCYLAGRRQINRALELGVREGENRAVLLVDSPAGDEAAEAEAVADLEDLVGLDTSADVLGEFDETRVSEYFDVSDAELGVVKGGLADVVEERVALLDVEK